MNFQTTDAAARTMIAAAHHPSNHQHIFARDPARRKPPSACRHVMKLPQFETTVRLDYTVDVFKPGARPRAFRHLSIQFSVPGQLTQGMITQQADLLNSMATDIVGAFFPFDTGETIRAHFKAQAPIPVVRAGQALTYRTPVLLHYTAPYLHDDIEDVAVVEGDTAPVQAIPYSQRDRDIAMARVTNEIVAFGLRLLESDTPPTLQEFVDLVATGAWVTKTPANTDPA